MQRVAPILVLLLFVVALVVALFPVPRVWTEDESPIETKLGLDLIGGLRGEYQVVDGGWLHIMIGAEAGRELQVAVDEDEVFEATKNLQYPDALYRIADAFELVLNPGSVGQPRDGDPRASFVLFDQDQAQVTWLRVPYSVERARQRILSAGLPGLLAERLAAGI